MQTAGQRDWTAKAAQGDPEAQFYLGLTLIRTNLVIARDSVPGLANLPVIGRHFQHTSADLDMNTDPDLMREAFQWIKKSADQGHAPARVTEKLFAHKIAELERMDEPDALPR